jgi:hypothetical protein
MLIPKEELEKLVGKRVILPSGLFWSRYKYDYIPAIIKEVGEGWVRVEADDPDWEYQEAILRIDKIEEILILKK